MRFVLLDRIVSLTPGQSVVATRHVAPTDDYFADHFPGFPVVPGVLLTEMMGQAASKCLDAERRPRGKSMLARILSASFRRWVAPGSDVTLNAAIGANTERYAIAECGAEVTGLAVAQARLFFTFIAPGTLAADFHDDVLDEFLARSAQ